MVSRMGTKNKKISIIGAGKVGSATAFTLAYSGIVSELVLIDVYSEKAEGEAMDIMHGAPLIEPVKIHTGDYRKIENSDIIIITAGANITPDQNRLSLVQNNLNIFKDVIHSMNNYIGDAILLVVSNPVDVMAYATQKLTGLPSKRVIGSGTVLDTSRFKTVLGDHLKVDARDIRGYILGEHGDSEFATWSSTNIASLRMEEFCEQMGLCSPETTKENIMHAVRTAGYEVIRRKGASQYAVALAVNTIVRSILMNQNSILTISTLLNGQYGLEDVYLSVPCIINRKGVDGIIEIPLARSESLFLERSANTLKDVIESIKVSL